MKQRQKCQHCAATAPLTPVPVKAMRGEERRTLQLCDRCRFTAISTWRLRWIEAEG